MSQGDDEAKDFFEYRGYLAFLARRYLSSRYNGKVDPSDIVQQTLVNAYTACSPCRGTKEGEILAWLRQILVNVIAHATREWHTKKRDIQREQSIAMELDASSMRLESLLVDKSPSPSQALDSKDRLRKVADAMERLPSEQRQALELKYWDNKSMEEMEEFLGKSRAALFGILSNAKRNIRKMLKDEAT